MRLPEALAAIRPAPVLCALRAALIGVVLLVGVLLGRLVVAGSPPVGAVASTAVNPHQEASPQVDSLDGRHWGRVSGRLITQPVARPRGTAHRAAALATTAGRLGPPTRWKARTARRGPATDRLCDPAVLQIYRC